MIKNGIKEVALYDIICMIKASGVKDGNSKVNIKYDIVCHNEWPPKKETRQPIIVAAGTEGRGDDGGKKGVQVITVEGRLCLCRVSCR